MPSITILNEFYQGLNLLVQFELSHSQGAMRVPFYALNRIIAYFDMAMNQGHVIAPHFLHYIAEKYPAFIDTNLLPKLTAIPTHKSQANEWIKCYQKFLTLNAKIDTFDNRIIIQNQSEITLALKKRRQETIDTFNAAEKLCESYCAISGLLAAKLLRRLQKHARFISDEMIMSTYLHSAFSPDAWAVIELSNYLSETNQNIPEPSWRKKLIQEVAALKQSPGEMTELLSLYQTQNAGQFYAEWLFQSAIHGDSDAANSLMYHYAQGDIEWKRPQISSKNTLREAIKWCDWITEHVTANECDKLWLVMTERCMQNQAAIVDNYNQACFWAYYIEKLNQGLVARSQQMPPKAFRNKYNDIIAINEHLDQILTTLWLLGGNNFPKLLNRSSLLLTDMARLLERNNQLSKARELYQKALILEPDHVIHQFNLANVLEKQGEDLNQAISLYFKAAHQGCQDSLRGLYRVCVINNHASIQQLHQLIQMLKELENDEAFLAPKELLINLANLSICQKETGKQLVRWRILEKDGQLFHDAEYLIAEEHIHSETETRTVERRSNLLTNTHNTELSPSPLPVNSPNPARTALGMFSSRNQRRLDSTARRLATRKERALRELETLNAIPRKLLTIEHLIRSKKLYNLLMGEAPGLAISNRGKTSGSRIAIDGSVFHLLHGRDRLKPGPQRKIKRAITTQLEEVKMMVPNTYPSRG